MYSYRLGSSNQWVVPLTIGEQAYIGPLKFKWSVEDKIREGVYVGTEDKPKYVNECLWPDTDL
jgi:hypothetical protein